ncbi:MAG: hypothetical protein ACRDFS_12535, partial [Chloroflexota bacterium]
MKHINGKGRRMRLSTAGAALLTSISFLAAACSSSTGSHATQTSGSTAPGQTAPSASSLVGICPNPVRIALYWTPEVELGPYYQLAAPGGAIDASSKTYTSALVDPRTGNSTGVNVELIAGGPALGFLKTEQVLYQ